MKRFESQRGVSLVEVLVVLAISAILVGFAVAQFGTAKDKFRRQNIARELKVNLERARFDSVKRRPSADNQMSRVEIHADRFYVYLDLNQDGTINNDTEKKLVDLRQTNDVRIVGDNLQFPVTVKFDKRGHITADRNNTVIPVPAFVVCDKGCTFQTAKKENSNKITISQTGTVSMTGGSDADTTVTTPNVSTVERCAQVNDWVTVSTSANSTIAGCSPTPTPSPSVSPSASVTPVPRACLSGERPDSDRCQCNLPLTVQKSGKCT